MQVDFMEQKAAQQIIILYSAPLCTTYSNASFILLGCATVLKVDFAKESWPCIFNHIGRCDVPAAADNVCNEVAG